ncbi:lipopeptide mating pheromone precursor Bap2(3) [Schizophyllum fasciatum]
MDAFTELLPALAAPIPPLGARAFAAEHVPLPADSPEEGALPCFGAAAARDAETLAFLADAEKPGGSLTYAWCVVA